MTAQGRRVLTSAAIGLAVGAVVFWITYGACIARMHRISTELDPSERATYLARSLGTASWMALGAGAVTALAGALLTWRALVRRDRSPAPQR